MLNKEEAGIKVRIAFLGASRYSYEVLEFLLANKFDICCIITLSGQSRKLHTFSDLKGLGEKYGIPVKEIGNKITDYLDEIKKYAPELILVFGWYSMIPKEIREIAPKGCVGIHGSLLPAYAGGSPLVWAIIKGEKETGISLFYMDGGMDTGDIISQKRVAIDYNDDISTLYAKAVTASKEILSDNLRKIEAGTASRIKQDLSGRTVYPQRTPKDGKIDWSMTAQEIRDFIRAQTKPYPGAYCYIEGQKMTIWKADAVRRQIKTGLPGEIIEAEEASYVVLTGKDYLRIIQFEPLSLRKVIERKDAFICLS